MFIGNVFMFFRYVYIYIYVYIYTFLYLYLKNGVISSDQIVGSGRIEGAPGPKARLQLVTGGFLNSRRNRLSLSGSVITFGLMGSGQY